MPEVAGAGIGGISDGGGLAAVTGGMASPFGYSSMTAGSFGMFGGGGCAALGGGMFGGAMGGAMFGGGTGAMLGGFSLTDSKGLGGVAKGGISQWSGAPLSSFAGVGTMEGLAGAPAGAAAVVSPVAPGGEAGRGIVNPGAPKLGDSGLSSVPATSAADAVKVASPTTDIKPVTDAAAKPAEIAKPEVKFVKSEADAHLTIKQNEKGELVHDWKKVPTAADKSINVFKDPKITDSAKVTEALNKANTDLKAKTNNAIEMKMPSDVAKAMKNPVKPGEKPAEKPKTNPPGGGGGGGGDAPKPKPPTPTPPPHTKKDHSSTKSDLPKSYNDMSSQISQDHTDPVDGSHYKGMHPDSYDSFAKDVYSRVPAYNAVGGLGSILSDIDAEEAADDPNSPGYAERQKARAARRAASVKDFQEKHGSEIESATEDVRKELTDFGDKKSAESFDSIKKTLSDPSKANDIANIFTQHESTGTKAENAGKVFDETARAAIANLALARSKDADWKSTSKDEETKKANIKKQADIVARVIYEPFKFEQKK